MSELFTMVLSLFWYMFVNLNLISCQDIYRDEASAQNLHKQMTQEELVQLFGTEFEETIPEYQIIHITQTEKLKYNFSAFGKFISLQLQPNKHLTGPTFKTIFRDHDSIEEMNGPDKNCYFLHSDATFSAAFSLCNQKGLNGIVFLTDDTFEIQPLSPRLHSLIGSSNNMQGPHIVKRAPLFNSVWSDEKFLPEEIIATQELESLLEPDHEKTKRSSQRPVVEVALFFDEAGYQLFQPYLHGDDKQLQEMLLAYMNGVQALYHHPSVGQLLDIVLTRLEVFKSQPPDLPHYGGERGLLLDSFCAYNAKYNPAGDEKAEHWDMGLYVSGLDFYAVENGQRNGATMGLATVGGVCLDKYACVIAELGTTNIYGKPYPSAGFTSVYILAHEIGHNLGMHHDSSSNSCPSEGYIMSPSRGTNGETQWSTCSAEIMRKLSDKMKCLSDKPASMPPERNHNKMHDAPGQLWGAKRQCEVLLKDKDAELQYPDKTEDMCVNLQCRTPHRSGYYFAGPALEGTACAAGKWCQGGVCIVMKKPKPEHIIKGGWSKWRTTEECLSGCITKSKGHQKKHRECNNPKPVNTEEGCEGSSFDVILCKDEKVCKKTKRKSAVNYAKEKCMQFSKILTILDPNGSGLQAPHEEGRKWVACAIFCSRRDTGSFYTPRLDLNDLNTDPYFPDGTWCHNDGKQNYYCMHHQCLPENFRGAKSLFDLRTDDLSIPQNALPNPLPLQEMILKYLSLDSEGRPLLTKISNKGSEKYLSDDVWASKDYLELPQSM